VAAAGRAGGRAASRRPLGIVLIALEKAVSTLALMAGAVFAFVLHGHPGRNPVELGVSLVVRGYPHNAVVHWLTRHVPYVPPDRALALGIGLLVWAGVFAAETVGVWLQARWGSLLVIGETAAFLPVQAWHIARHPQPFEYVTAPVNLAILGYLVHAYRGKISEGRR
jgi:uncharacterized membrane protein (DUF2068 family)